MLKLNSLLLFSEAPKKLVDFYRQILSREPKWQEGEFSGFEDGACAFAQRTLPLTKRLLGAIL